MTQVLFYGQPLPGLKESKLPGKLVVLEGTDGVVRSTQIALLREALEADGYAVAETGLRRSDLAGRGIKKAKTGHTMGDLTMNLFYATDFVDRLEKNIVPALRAGFVVLTDRYIYSLIARAQVRGVDSQWIRDVLGLALIPDVVFYLKIGVEHLIPRVINAGGFDYWESGMDCGLHRDRFLSFVKYQRRIRREFLRMQKRYAFELVNGNRSIAAVDRDLRGRIQLVLDRVDKPAERRVTRGRVG